ncbi:MAG: NADH-quinone oxidoreductase subunit J [Pseudomonadota bacterium]|nr:NADH-quinone oxidoreductase subunit J [Pseudomonadota bacterium]
MIWPFYLAAAVALISTLRVVTHTNPVHALLNLIVSLLAIAALFFCLGAPLAGALEIVVYAGAILVLFVFVVMMLNLGSAEVQEQQWFDAKTWAVPALLSFILGLMMVWMIRAGTNGELALGTETVEPKAVAISLFGAYVLLVEVAAFLLLAALVASFHLGKRLPDEHSDDGAQS